MRPGDLSGRPTGNYDSGQHGLGQPAVEWAKATTWSVTPRTSVDPQSSNGPVTDKSCSRCWRRVSLPGEQ